LADLKLWPKVNSFDAEYLLATVAFAVSEFHGQFHILLFLDIPTTITLNNVNLAVVNIAQCVAKCCTQRVNLCMCAVAVMLKRKASFDLILSWSIEAKPLS